MNRLGTALSLSVALLACAGIGRADVVDPLDNGAAPPGTAVLVSYLGHQHYPDITDKNGDKADLGLDVSSLVVRPVYFIGKIADKFSYGVNAIIPGVRLKLDSDNVFGAPSSNTTGLGDIGIRDRKLGRARTCPKLGQACPLGIDPRLRRAPFILEGMAVERGELLAGRDPLPFVGNHGRDPPADIEGEIDLADVHGAGQHQRAVAGAAVAQDPPRRAGALENELDDAPPPAVRSRSVGGRTRQ